MNSTQGSSAATAVYVAYRSSSIDLAWIPDHADVVVVHNDDHLDERACEHPRVRHLHTGRNLGFGAGVNAALPLIQTERVVICNPDTQLRPEHWTLLADGMPDELRIIALVDGRGCPTATVNRYPTPISMLLTGYRVGRVLHRDNALRRHLEPLLGQWGTEHGRLREVRCGTWPLSDHWSSGALFSVDIDRLRAIGGFDPGYFLYVEDVDLGHRLATHFPHMRIHMPHCAPGIHSVGGSSASGPQRAAAQAHHFDSVRRYARSRPGIAWRLTDLALAPRSLAVSRHRVTAA